MVFATHGRSRCPARHMPPSFVPPPGNLHLVIIGLRLPLWQGTTSTATKSPIASLSTWGWSFGPILTRGLPKVSAVPLGTPDTLLSEISPKNAFGDTPKSVIRLRWEEQSYQNASRANVSSISRTTTACSVLQTKASKNRPLIDFFEFQSIFGESWRVAGVQNRLQPVCRAARRLRVAAHRA